MWPGSALHGMYIWENPRWEDYEYKIKEEQEGNPFSWFGNGYVTTQLADDVHGTTFYLDDENSRIPEENPLLSKRKPVAMVSAGPLEGIAGAA